MAYFTYQGKLRRAKAIERGLKMVPILIHLPPPSEDTEGGNRDIRDIMREKTAQAEVLYNLLAGTATQGFKSNFYGQRHVALEMVATDGLVHFYAAVPVALTTTVQKAILTAFPGARIEETEDHNIFNQEGRLAATMGGELILKTDSAYPIATYATIERDPMEAIITTLSGLGKDDGAAIQIMIRPASASWLKHATKVSDMLRRGRNKGIVITPMELAKATIVAPKSEAHDGTTARRGEAAQLSNLELSIIEKVEEKTKHPAFEVLVRVVVSTQTVATSQQLLRDIATTFALFDAPGLNGFKFLPAQEVQGLVTAFIFRFFPPEAKGSVLNSVELATLFHLPDFQFTPTRSLERQMSKEVDGPVSMPTEGLLFGYNEFRGARKEIRMSEDDRRRHTYILGQTGTGKSVMLENLAVQDMQAGRGFAFIDPHGETAEKLLGLIPKERAEDVIYFNPSDMDYPLGLNLFEFTDPRQKDFLVQESINMLYKLYDPGKTGVIGPRFEHWFRNAALTLMSDPNGASFIEIPKVFTDTEYLKQKFKYLKDPTVIEFWTKEMAQTSDYHKSEMLGWFVSKFGAFLNNETMRNILGQTESSFNLREIMDNKKILIVNLSKGQLGELNSNLLGMIFVIKFQAAAMSRADMDPALRNDFSLYVDEFQNFSTDSFATILSEARKYRLNLIVANQFIGQLSPEIRDAIFGNVGTMIAHRMGPEDAEFMVKQLAPVFDASDLTNIPNLHSAVRMLIGGLPSQPFTMADLPWVEGVNNELALAIKQLSAAKFGHSRNDVEADLQQRLTGKAVVPAVTPPPAPVTPLTTPEPPTAPSPVPVMEQATTPVTPVAEPSVSTPVMPTLPPTEVPTPTAKAEVSVPEPSTEVPSLKPLVAEEQPVVENNKPPLDTTQTPVVTEPSVPTLPAAEIDQTQLASTPPPIGAPPVSLDTTPPVVPAPITPPPTLAPVVAPASVVPELPVVETVTDPIPAPLVVVNESVDTSLLATMPPPIGAPPVALASAPGAVKDPFSLSVSDITGGQPIKPAESRLDKSEQRQQEALEESTIANDPLGGVPLLAVAAPEPEVVAGPLAEEVLAADPFIDVPLIDAPAPELPKPETKPEPEPAPSTEPEITIPSEPSPQDMVTPKPEAIEDQPKSEEVVNEPVPDEIKDELKHETEKSDAPEIQPPANELPESEVTPLPESKLPLQDDQTATAPEVAAEEPQGAMAGTGGYIHFVDPKLEEVLEEDGNGHVPTISPVVSQEPAASPVPDLPESAEVADGVVFQAEPAKELPKEGMVEMPQPEANAVTEPTPLGSQVVPTLPEPETPVPSKPKEPVVPERSTDEVLAAVMAAAAKRRGAIDDAPTEAPAGVIDQLTSAKTMPPVSQSSTKSTSQDVPAPVDMATNNPVVAFNPDDAVKATEHRIDELLSESLLDSNGMAKESLTISEPLPEPEYEPAPESVITLEVPTLPRAEAEDVAPIEAVQASTAESVSDESSIVLHTPEDRPESTDGRVVTGTDHLRERLPEPAPTPDESASELDPEDTVDTPEQHDDEAHDYESHQRVIQPLEEIPGKELAEQPVIEQPEVTEPEPVVETPLVALPEEDFALPEAESLAAADVEAAQAQAESTPLAPEVLVPSPAVAPEAVQIVATEEPVVVPSTEAQAEPAVAPEAQPAPQLTPTEPQKAPEDAPSGLIMPTKVKSEDAPSQPAAGSVKPEKLAKGEVFVDETGNVIIGE